MSLINDYLKKTQDEAPPPDQPGDVPPLLKSGGKSGGGKLALRISVIAVLGIVAGVVYYNFQSSVQETNPPPELVASLGERTLEQPASSKAPAATYTTRAPEENLPVVRAIAAAPAKEESKPTHTEREAPAVKPVKTEPAPEAPAQQPAEAIESEPAAVITSSPQPKKVVRIAQASPPVKIAPIEKPERPTAVEVDLNHYFQIGLMAQKDGNFQEAQRFYREVLVQDPAHMGALINLAAVYIHQKKTTDAEKTLRKILRIDPKNTKALVNLGIINITLNEVEQARTRFQEALRIDPREETALFNLAFLANREGDTALAETYYKDILSITPQNAEVLLAYASLLERDGRFAEALSCYQRSLEVAAVQENEQLHGQVKKRINVLRYYYGQQR
jgi:Tfp pilus assembly protein PilF